VLSNRYYLAGADFLVGLESDSGAVLAELQDALRSPMWQLSLGRKSFLPSVPIYLPGNGGSRTLGMREALQQEPWPLRPSAWRLRDGTTKRLRLVLEADFSGPARPETRNDQPLGAAFRDRTFGPRAIVHELTPELSYKEHPDVSQPAHAQPS